MKKNIKKRIDLYPLTHVDCVEKAVCCMLNMYNEEWSSAFLMYDKWYSLFENNKDLNTELEVLEYMCREGVLPIQFKAIEIQNESVSDVVKHEIESGYTCLVPGNLRELIYSKYYNKGDWPHLFFVNNVCSEDDFFYIMDSCHKDENEQKFSPFVMEYKNLDRVFKAFSEAYDYALMYNKLNVIVACKLLDNQSELVNCVDISGKYIKKLSYEYNGDLEHELFNSIISKKNAHYNDSMGDISGFLTDDKIRFNHIIKRKEVFYSEVIYNLCFFDLKLKDSLLSYLDDIIGNWNACYRYIIASTLRKKFDTSSINQKLNEAISKEKVFINCIVNITEKKEICNTSESVWVTYNDEPGEIIISDNTIKMQTCKNHNAWFDDEALEAIFYKANGEKIFTGRLSMKVVLEGALSNNNYNVGIVVKTLDNRMYVWGIYNDECMRLSEIGVKVDKEDYYVDKLNEMIIGVEAKGNSLILLAESDGYNRITTSLPDLTSNIKELGVIFKTWENKQKDNIKVFFNILDIK